MKFKIKTEIYTSSIHPLADLPSFEVETDEDLICKQYGNIPLMQIAEEEFFSDEGKVFGIGTKVIIERVK